MTKALVALKETDIIWPGETERKTAKAIHVIYGFPNCYDVVDET